MRRLSELFSAAAQTVRDVRAAATKREPIDFGSAGGIAGPQTVLIAAVDGTVFRCRWRGPDGQPIGESFVVHAFSVAPVGGLIGQQPLDNCDPRRVAGNPLRIEYRSEDPGDGVPVTGWWTVLEFTPFECEVECP
jgi:hypothetical protein